jgi:hypothetical protein
MLGAPCALERDVLRAATTVTPGPRDQAPRKITARGWVFPWQRPDPASRGLRRNADGQTGSDRVSDACQIWKGGYLRIQAAASRAPFRSTEKFEKPVYHSVASASNPISRRTILCETRTVASSRA